MHLVTAADRAPGVRLAAAELHSAIFQLGKVDCPAPDSQAYAYPDAFMLRRVCEQGHMIVRPPAYPGLCAMFLHRQQLTISIVMTKAGVSGRVHLMLPWKVTGQGLQHCQLVRYLGRFARQGMSSMQFGPASTGASNLVGLLFWPSRLSLQTLVHHCCHCAFAERAITKW